MLCGAGARSGRARPATLSRCLWLESAFDGARRPAAGHSNCAGRARGEAATPPVLCQRLFRSTQALSLQGLPAAGGLRQQRRGPGRRAAARPPPTGQCHIRAPGMPIRGGISLLY